MIYVDSDEIANFLRDTGDWHVRKLTHMEGYCCIKKLTTLGIAELEQSGTENQCIESKD